MSKILYIVDIKKKQNNSFNLKKILLNDAEVLSLTPYSCYLLDKEKKKYSTFHSIISMQKFTTKVFEEYSCIENIINKYLDYSALFRNIAIIKTYEVYINILFKFIKNKKKEKYTIVYISDAKNEDNINNFRISSNDLSALYYCKDIDQYIKLTTKEGIFYKKNNFKNNFSKISKIINYILKDKKKVLNYDHKFFKNFWNKQTGIILKNHIPKEEYEQFYKDMIKVLYTTGQHGFITALYENFLNSIQQEILKSKMMRVISISPFVYLSSPNDIVRNVLYKKNDISRVFWQHGSYVHEHIFLPYNEITVADLNFVFNNFTEKMFKLGGNQKSYSVGSINFNKKFIEKKKKFDFVYIINNMQYSWNATYLDSKNALYAMDGNNLFQKHKEIIELFGMKFPDKNFCIKTQPGVFTGSMLYVPFLELSKKFKNVTIEFTKPLAKLFEQSTYIISDYFSSEFTNKELHCKRDIILFKGYPLPLPEETLEDMDKMFILVDTIDDLQKTIENIDEVTKNRRKNDDIIEYYSSKKCNTKKVVTEILEKEINARR